MANKKYYVLEYKSFTNGKGKYDILPYFRNVWKNSKWNFEKDKVKDKKTLQKWILRTARYQYWARCEYEFLMASWPFGSKQMYDELKDFMSSSKDLNDYKTKIDLDNIIIRDMDKIDVYEQIEMNIDIITDILYNEFFNKNVRKEKKNEK